MNELITLESTELKGIEISKAEQIKAVFDPMSTMLLDFEDEFNTFLSSLVAAKTEHDKKQAEIAIENERLIKEAEENERIRKEEETKRKAAEEKARIERENKERKEREAHEAALRKEREERARIEREERAKREAVERELAEKKAAEESAKAEAEAKLQAELSKGDSDKVADLVSDLESLKTKYVFKSAKNKKMYYDVSVLINKTISFIQGR